ncbi:CBL-interacting serine/threonine-protein kinase 1-like protein [Tanacetum coccineum]|uniref:CBL-interacting serine/threonine-protein kinase 1-like protein n=1 Tax=Tanacetum coccineum TaxID=301880 RepID=A0ABQ4ZCX6_9ASTR
MMFSGSIQVDDFVAHVITKGIPRYLSQTMDSDRGPHSPKHRNAFGLIGISSSLDLSGFFAKEVQLPRKLSYKLGRSLFNKADAGKDQCASSSMENVQKKNDDDFVAIEHLNEYSRRKPRSIRDNPLTVGLPPLTFAPLLNISTYEPPPYCEIGVVAGRNFVAAAGQDKDAPSPA